MNLSTPVRLYGSLGPFALILPVLPLVILTIMSCNRYPRRLSYGMCTAQCEPLNIDVILPVPVLPHILIPRGMICALRGCDNVHMAPQLTSLEE
jgi:hypothetical protein